jgi:hypothetical protein
MNSGGDALATQGAIPGKADSTPEMEDCAILGGHKSFLIRSRNVRLAQRQGQAAKSAVCHGNPLKRPNSETLCASVADSDDGLSAA